MRIRDLAGRPSPHPELIFIRPERAAGRQTIKKPQMSNILLDADRSQEERQREKTMNSMEQGLSRLHRGQITLCGRGCSMPGGWEQQWWQHFQITALLCGVLLNHTIQDPYYFNLLLVFRSWLFKQCCIKGLEVAYLSTSSA